MGDWCIQTGAHPQSVVDTCSGSDQSLQKSTVHLHMQVTSTVCGEDVWSLTVSESRVSVLMKMTRRTGVHVSLWMSASRDTKYCRLSLINLHQERGRR